MDHQKAWSNGHLKKVIQEAHLDRRDAAWPPACALECCKTGCLDHYLQQYSTMKLTKMESKGATASGWGCTKCSSSPKFP